MTPLPAVERAAQSYRKKPVVIQAFKLGTDPMPDWFMDAVSANTVTLFNDDGRHRGGPDHALIKTLEGTHRADFGDYIIRGIKGELYPCKPDIFAATYEAATLSPAGQEPPVAWVRYDPEIDCDVFTDTKPPEWSALDWKPLYASPVDSTDAGWVRVPPEATDVMRDALREGYDKKRRELGTDYFKEDDAICFAAGYKLMLSAAPKK